MAITKLLYHPITILALTIVAIMFFFSLDKSSKKTQSSSENIRVLEYEIDQISNEIIGLEEKIELTESEQFKEKVVRNELLLQKPGEYILQIQENTEAKPENKLINKTKTVTPLENWKEILL